MLELKSVIKQWVLGWGISNFNNLVHQDFKDILETIALYEHQSPLRSKLLVFIFIINDDRVSFHKLLFYKGLCHFLFVILCRLIFINIFILWGLLLSSRYSRRLGHFFFGYIFICDYNSFKSISLPLFHNSLNNLEGVQKLINWVVIEELVPINLASLGVSSSF